MKAAAAMYLACAVAASAQIKLYDGTPLAFGDRLVDLQVELDERAYDVEHGRPGIDQLIALQTAELGFDTGRLWRITLRENYRFPHPPVIYREAWKNFTPIGERQLHYRMSRAEFDAYLADWQARATTGGKTEKVDYWIVPGGSKSDGERIFLTFAPRRRFMGTGTLVGDMVSILFSGTIRERHDPDRPAGTLESVMLLCDAFRTAARETPESAAPPAPRRNGHPLAAAGELSPPVTLDDGRTLRFGQALAEVEKSLGVASRDNPLPIARQDRDRQIVAPTVTLDFDTGRLGEITFKPTHEFVHPVRVFDAPWKNPDPIGELRLRRALPRVELIGYLDAWKKRAAKMGKREKVDYDINTEPGNEFMGEMISLSFAPERLTGNGLGIWSDDWTVHLTAGPDAVLESMSVLLDSYNTRARPPPGTRDPALAGVTLEDGTELYFGQSQAEVERLIGKQATAPSMRPDNRIYGLPRLSLPQVGLTFDAERLAAIDFRRIMDPPAPFPEQWKNLVAIDGKQIAIGMTREELDDYLAAWHAKAAKAGFALGQAYYVRESNSDRVQGVMIGLPSSGTSAGGKRVADTWQFSFNARGEEPHRRWVLISAQASRGALSSATPTPAEQRRSEFRATTSEPPPLEMPKPEIPRPDLGPPK